MVRAALLVVLVLTAGLSGCLAEDPGPSDDDEGERLDGQNVPRGQSETAEGPSTERERRTGDEGAGGRFGPQANVALIDTGINPYHIAFRDDSPLAYTHPSEYLPGYPTDAQALELTLEAESFGEALEADRHVWGNVTEEQLYWIPGTKIVAAYATEAGDPPILSVGHGTMTASRAAGSPYSLCPECRITVVQGFNADAVEWASQQPWIDAQSNSWSPIVAFEEADPVQAPGLSEAFERAAQRHLVFGSAGNGVGGKAGVLGHPSFTRSTSGPPGVISVGGHDNGEVVLWSGSAPHVVADACDNMAPDGDSIDDFGPHGGGTSSASPYAAGAAAHLVLEARRLLGDEHRVGVDNGTLARGQADEALGEPLADGDLTIEEVKRVLMRTADPRPSEGAHDGEVCTTRALYNTVPVPWDEIPEEVPAYYFIGYGAVSPASLDMGLAVLAGEQDLPAREQADQQHSAVQQVREAYHSVP